MKKIYILIAVGIGLIIPQTNVLAAPPAPTNVISTIDCSNPNFPTITVSWNTVTNVTGYRAYVNGASAPNHAYQGTAANWTDTNVTNSRAFIYRVTAYDSTGESIQSIPTTMIVADCNQNQGGSTQNPGGSSQNPGGSTQNPGGSTPAGSCAPGGQGSLFNPLAQAGVCNIPDLINWLIRILFAFVGLVASLAVVIGGYQMIVGTQKGEKDKIMVGKNTIFWAITGMIVVLFAYTIIRVVLRTFTNT